MSLKDCRDICCPCTIWCGALLLIDIYICVQSDYEAAMSELCDESAVKGVLLVVAILLNVYVATLHNFACT